VRGIPGIGVHLRFKFLLRGLRRMDETYVRVRGTEKYLYRAVEKAGATAEFLLITKRDRKVALRFLCKAVKWSGTPEKITIDENGANTAANDCHN
jgi:transposase-like protein